MPCGVLSLYRPTASSSASPPSLGRALRSRRTAAARRTTALLGGNSHPKARYGMSRVNSRWVAARAEDGDSEGGAGGGKRAAERPKAAMDDVDEGLIGAVGTWLAWAGLLAYTFYFSPNQTPLRDSYFLEKLLLQNGDDGVQLNTILTSLVALIAGVFPCVYTALLTPAAKNGNSVPAWPFLAASVFAGSFALLPYFALWEPSKDTPQMPPPADKLTAVSKVTESRVFATALLVAATALLGRMATAGGMEWYQFVRLWEESRLVHVTTLDFFVLAFATPFWMYTDATARGFKQEGLLPLFIALPGVGPALYLLLRPRSNPE